MSTGINSDYARDYMAKYGATSNANRLQPEQSKFNMENTYVLPIDINKINSIYQPGAEGTETNPAQNNGANCADGVDDGSIGFFGACKNLLKGGIKFVTGMFTDENGDFSIGQTLKTLLIGGLVAAATCIPVVGPLVLPALCTAGMVHGGVKVLSGLSDVMGAKTDAEAEAAWEQIGNGATEGVISAVGYKASGGWSKALDASKAQYTARFGSDAASVKTGTGASVEDAEFTEVIDEAPALEAKPASTTDTSASAGTTKTTDLATVEKPVTSSEVTAPNKHVPNKQTPQLEQRQVIDLEEGVDYVEITDEAAVTQPKVKYDGPKKMDPIERQQLVEQNESFTQAELDAYAKENGYHRTNWKRTRAAQEKGVNIVDQPTGNARQTLADVKGGDKLAALKDQLAAEEAQVSQVATTPKTNSIQSQIESLQRELDFMEYDNSAYQSSQVRAMKIKNIQNQIEQLQSQIKVQAETVQPKAPELPAPQAKPATVEQPAQPAQPAQNQRLTQIDKWNRRYSRAQGKTYSNPSQPVAEQPVQPAAPQQTAATQTDKFYARYPFLRRTA